MPAKRPSSSDAKRPTTHKRVKPSVAPTKTATVAAPVASGAFGTSSASGASGTAVSSSAFGTSGTFGTSAATTTKASKIPKVPKVSLTQRPSRFKVELHVTTACDDVLGELTEVGDNMVLAGTLDDSIVTRLGARKWAIFCDGACTANGSKHARGGSGIYIVRTDDTGAVDEQWLYSIALTEVPSTNNRAELYAVLFAIQLLHRIWATDEYATTKRDAVHIYTDSQYTIDAVEGRKCVIANRELIEQVRVQYRSLARAEFHYVAGHANVMGNEVANFLAQRATRPAQRAK